MTIGKISLRSRVLIGISIATLAISVCALASLNTKKEVATDTKQEPVITKNVIAGPGRVEPDLSMKTKTRTSPSASLQDLRQVRTYQIAPFVQAECIALGAVAVQLFFPFHHVCLAPVFLDEFADTIAAFAGAFGAFDAEHVELILDVAKDEISPPRHDGILSLVL